MSTAFYDTGPPRRRPFGPRQRIEWCVKNQRGLNREDSQFAPPMQTRFRMTGGSR
jgi:hypothetical protein